MIEFKIYTQISNFVNINHRTKVHTDILLLYILELMSTATFY